MDQWSKVDEAGVSLATMRIYKKPLVSLLRSCVLYPQFGVCLFRDPDGKQKITITIPEDAPYDLEGVARDWEFNLDNSAVRSQYVFSDKPKEGSTNKRSRKSPLLLLAFRTPLLNAVFRA